MPSASSSGNSEAVLPSYPPPPPWYKEFTTSESFRTPPPFPDRTYSCFGWPRVAIQNEKKGTAALPILDSDTRLFSGTDSKRHICIFHCLKSLYNICWYLDIPDLKQEFKRLFSLMTEAILKLCTQLSEMGYPSSDSTGSTVQNIIKLQKNLQHILALLRYWEAKEEILKHFQQQLKSRKVLLAALDHCLSPDCTE